jgi:hypothetical protein
LYGIGLSASAGANPLPACPPGSYHSGPFCTNALRSHTDKAQVTEIAIAVEVLNRMLD